MNLPLTLLLRFAVVLAALAALRLTGHTVRLKPLFLVIGLAITYWIVSPLGLWVQGHMSLLSRLHWNWLGKTFAILAALTYWRLIPGMGREEIGLTWRQRLGSFLPAAVVVLPLCLFSWTDEARAANGRSLAPERLLYQAIMPGLDEELVFRGLLLALFARCLKTDRVSSNVSFGLEGLAVTFLFAAGHGLFVTSNHSITVNWHALIVTGVIGAGLVWLRNRTGSLVAPVIAHNLINFGNSFF